MRLLLGDRWLIESGTVIVILETVTGTATAIAIENAIVTEIENATDVIPHRMLSWVKEFNSRSARISKSRQEASSEPVAKASPLGKNLQKKSASLFGYLSWYPTHTTQR